MPVRSLLAALCLLAVPCVAPAAAAAAAASRVSIPATPSGRALSAWLDAFNSGDRARLEAFRASYGSQSQVDGDMRWRNEVGGYDLLAVYTNDATHILFRLKARADGGEEIGTLQVSDSEPRTLVELGGFRVASGARFEAVTLDDANRRRVVNQVAGLLRDAYIYPATGQSMAAAILQRIDSPAYRALRDGRYLARQLTRDLRDVSHDQHLEVRFSYVVQPADLSWRDPDEESRRLATLNCGFARAEHLLPNIGYVKFDMFAGVKACGPTASAAMNFVADSAAVILDLRDNSGGGGGMVEYIASYLFAGPVHLDPIVGRTPGIADQASTWPEVPGRKFPDKPLYVLTSRRTFSAAEYLVNTLREQKRAIVVGETTGGGEHTVETRRIDDHFSIRIPNGRVLTDTDWEVIGIEPDIEVPAADALEEALRRARTDR